mgnify:CR=1 FL=1
MYFATCVTSGSIDSLTYIIFGNYMNPIYLATGLELAYCLASIIASTAPIITHSP